MRSFYIFLAKMFPKSYWKYLKQLLIYAGEKDEVEIYLGRITFVSILFSIIIILIPISFWLNIKPIYTLLSAIFTFLFVEFLFYLLLYFKVEDRAKRVENFLPDALQLISTNLLTGMTPFKSLRLAARKEFGPLYEEIHFATSKAYGVSSFSGSLQTISKRIKSEVLERAFDLFTTALRAGGHLSSLLEELAKDIEETKSLKRELITSTKTSVSFVLFSVIIGAPLLLTISIQFLEFLVGMKENLSSGSFFGVGLISSDLLITPSFMLWLSLFMLFFTSLLAGILLGVLMEGKVNYGFRYMPIIAILSFIVFFVSKLLVGNFFTTMT